MGNFRKLKVWQKAKNLSVDIYRLTERDLFHKDFSLKDQIRRAAVSIPSNIAEGDERFSNKESIRFLFIANASAAELITQIIIANEIGYIDKKESESIVKRVEEISKMIKALISFRRNNDRQK